MTDVITDGSPFQISRYGWRRQRPDHRDHIFNDRETVLTNAQVAPTGGCQPNEVPEIWNQLQLGTCVPHGSLRAFLTMAMHEGLSLPMLSRLFVYAFGRQLEGTDLSTDSGMEVRDAFTVLTEYGCPPEDEWPYSDANPGPFQQVPSASVVADALKHVAIDYQSINAAGRGAPMRTALSRKYVIAYGFSVPDYFEDPARWDPASGQPLPLPGPNTKFIGGHCVAARWYDFSEKSSSGPGGFFRQIPYFTSDNSWSESWGMKGSFNIDYRWFDPQRGLATDLWIAKKVN